MAYCVRCCILKEEKGSFEIMIYDLTRRQKRIESDKRGLPTNRWDNTHHHNSCETFAKPVVGI